MRHMKTIAFLVLVLSHIASANVIHFQAKINDNQFTYSKINTFLSDDFDTGVNANAQLHIFATEWDHASGKQVATSEAIAPTQVSFIRGNTRIKDVFIKYQPSQSDMAIVMNFISKGKQLHNTESLICKLEDGITLTGACNFFTEHKGRSVYVTLYFSELKRN